MAKRELNDEDIGIIVARAIEQAEDETDSLSSERNKVRKYYDGKLPGPMFKGDSSHVSRDVHDVVNAMRANVEEAFSAHNQTVEFEPDFANTADDSKQATNFCKQVFYKHNNGEDIIYSTITDGLMYRIGVVKVFVDEKEDREEYDVVEATIEEIAQELPLIEGYSEEETELEPDENGLWNGKIVSVKKRQNIVIETIQPEDFLIDPAAKSVRDAKFVAHRTAKTRSWIVENFGESVADDISYGLSRSTADEYELSSRRDGIYNMSSEFDLDESTKEVYVYECYSLFDIERTGTAELWKILYCDKKVLSKERVAFNPFAAFVPQPIPHTFIGENYAASIIPIQNAKTVSYRQTLNHNLMTANPRFIVNSQGLPNPDELLDNRFGGIINVTRPDAVSVLPQPQLNPYIMGFMTMMNEDKEQLSGITKLSQGMNKDALSTQNAEGKVEMLMSAAQTKSKVIARKFGDFLGDVFYLIYNTAIDYLDSDTIVEISGVQADVNPAQWKKRTPATVKLTLGYAERENKVNDLTQIHMMFSQDPVFQAQYTPQNRYEIARQVLENKGIPNVESILTPPDQMPPPQPDPMQEITLQREQLSNQHLQEQIAQMQHNREIEIMQMQIKQMEAETDRMRVANQMDVAQSRVAIEAERVQNQHWKEATEMSMAQEAEDQRAIISP